MKIHTVESMKEVLVPEHLSIEDLEERNIFLSEYNYSVIVEGQYHEFDCLNGWIEENFDTGTILDVWLTKTGYDFGFAEFFMKDKVNEEKLRCIIPNMYYEALDWKTNKRIVTRSNGYGNFDRNPVHKDAILYPWNGKGSEPTKVLGDKQ